MRINNFYRYLINNHYEKYNSCLLYGNSINILNFYTSFWKEYFQKFNVQYANNLSDIKLDIEPTLFELDTKKKIYICKNIASKDFNTLPDILCSIPKGNYLLLIGEGHNTKSNFVKYFSSHENICAVPCYDISENNLQEMVSYSLKTLEIKLTREQLHFLTAHYINDLNTFFNDINKIKLYIGNNSTITDEDIKLIVNNSGKDHLYSNIANYFLLRKQIKLTKFIVYINSTTEIITVIRYVVRFLLLLQEYLYHYKYEKSIPATLIKMNNKIFFNTKPLFEQSIPLWNIKSVEKTLKSMLTIEKSYKNKEISTEQFQRNFLNCLTQD